MKLDQTFTVQADPGAVWKALTDVMRVAPNLPGAAITDDAGGGMYKGEFKVKIGPTTATYNGTLKLEELDQEHRVATMSARGTDKRGNGGATATIVSRVHADAEAGGTRVDVETDFSITGKLARFGRGGMIQDVSNRLLREFAANLQADLAGEGGAAAPEPPLGSATGATTASGDASEQGSGEPTGEAEAPRPSRAPVEPVGAIGLALGAVASRSRAAAPPLLAGFVLGAVAARRWEVRRR